MNKVFFTSSQSLIPDKIRLMILAIAAALLLATGSYSRVLAQEAFVLDVTAGEFGTVTMSGFSVDAETRASIQTVCLDGSRVRPLASSAWVLDAGTRELVWEFDDSDVERSRDNLVEAADEIVLPAGSYEVYYSSHVDWRQNDWDERNLGDVIRRAIREIFDRGRWLDSDRREDRFRELQDRLGVQVRLNRSAVIVENKDDLATAFLSTAFLTITSVPDNSYIVEGFELERPLDVEVYALGEFVDREAYDFGWIINVDTRKKVWEMDSRDLEHAGGATKNRMHRHSISLEPGRYAAFFTSDGSHSPTDWNAAPPYDADFWGMTLRVETEDDLRLVSRFDYETISLDQAIVALRQIGDSEHQSTGFSVARPLEVRIYALGEGSDGRMYDYGWIIDAETHEHVWRMDYESTEHAGGARKNRLFDGVIKLRSGNYVAHYVTDGSHSFEDWNSDRPYDAEAWGLTVAPADPKYADRLSPYSPSSDRSSLASITEVGDGENRQAEFTLEKDTRVRIFALGEGSGGQMYDYGWIERTGDSAVVWEMTYRMTEHAGGAGKNRRVNTVFVLPAGSYRLHYTSDGSHSYGDWNADPPFEPNMWGITVSVDRRAAGI